MGTCLCTSASPLTIPPLRPMPRSEKWNEGCPSHDPTHPTCQAAHLATCQPASAGSAISMLHCQHYIAMAGVLGTCDAVHGSVAPEAMREHHNWVAHAARHQWHALQAAGWEAAGRAGSGGAVQQSWWRWVRVVVSRVWQGGRPDR